jgi:hypothetical protein
MLPVGLWIIPTKSIEASPVDTITTPISDKKDSLDNTFTASA